MALYAQSATAVTPGLNWKDSYSVDGQCYCDTTYDHETADIIVGTPAGNRTVRQVCETIGPGPGAGNNPIYNDVQCGNGPPNNAIDEVLCPGRVDIGKEGCSVIGPTWNLHLFFPDPDEGRNQPIDQSGIPAQPVIVVPETNDTILIIDETPGGNTETEPSSSIELTPTPSGTTIQPVGLVVAASNYSSADNRWVLVNAQSTGNSVGPDSDEPHIDSALNGQYMELLPDVKVTNADEAGSDNVWPIPGQGPQVQFDINIAQAGTYAVYVRAYSTGEFDDTIHVGFDGIWPLSGANINTCSTRDTWIWTQCANTDAPTIKIPTSGTHTIQFAGRDDGFEFDQFVLQLLNDDGTPAAQPLNQLQAQSGIEPTEQNTNNQLAQSSIDSASQLGTESEANENSIPELGQAVTVGAGSIAFASAPVTCLVMLISGLCLLLHRFKATARNEQPTARSDRST